MVKQSGRESFRVCFKLSDNYYILIGRFKSREVALRSDALQSYFIKKYGKTGPDLSHTKFAIMGKKKKKKKPSKVIHELRIKVISDDGLVYFDNFRSRPDLF